MDWLSPVSGVLAVAFPFFERLPIIRAILGFLLVFFLPGFAWSFIFFKQLQALERIGLSFALSLVLVTLAILLANRLGGVRITALNSAVIIVTLTIMPIFGYYLRKAIGRKRLQREPGQTQSKE